MRRVFLIDCPGVVYPTGESETDSILKGVVHVERVDNLEEYIPELLARVKPEYIQRTYGILSWKVLAIHNPFSLCECPILCERPTLLVVGTSAQTIE